LSFEKHLGKIYRRAENEYRTTEIAMELYPSGLKAPQTSCRFKLTWLVTFLTLSFGAEDHDVMSTGWKRESEVASSLLAHGRLAAFTTQAHVRLIVTLVCFFAGFDPIRSVCESVNETGYMAAACLVSHRRRAFAPEH
jgi:hypothetical protein